MDKQKKLKFIHITKTAGTAIEELGIKHKIKWGRYDNDIKKLTKHVPYIYNYAWWHIPTIFYDKDMLTNIKKKYDFFTIVRNPYSRIISEMLCKWGSKSYYHDIIMKETSTISYINKQIQIILTKVQQFIKGNKELPDGHWLPQYLFIYDKNGKKIIKKSNIIHFENIKEELNKLFAKYKLDIDFNNAPRILCGANNYMFSINDLSVDNIKLINKIYSNDFKLFGYKKR